MREVAPAFEGAHKQARRVRFVHIDGAPARGLFKLTSSPPSGGWLGFDAR